VSDETTPPTGNEDPSGISAEIRPETSPEIGTEISPEIGTETSPEISTGSPRAEAETSGDAGPEYDGAEDSKHLDLLEQEGDIAADYLEELLDIADLDGDLDMDVEGDRAAVSIVGADLTQLVGRDGEVLEALQELTRLAVYRETGERSRLMLDISGYRADKRAALEKLAEATASEVKESGEPVALDPMTPFERKVVHDAVAEAGLTSESEGEEPRRYVVVLPR
jgi:spoIIIJ-associated protein